MPNVKYQIFVSSTYVDLRDEREAVIRACLEMGHIPVGMEMFNAADEEQWKMITRQIDQSDYYVLVVAHRYGSMAGDVSYTEKEYDYAVQQGVPTLGFVIDDGASWHADRMDSEIKSKKALAAFKKKVRRKPVDYWSSASDLKAKCAIALGKAINISPRPGWVRSTEVAGPEVVEELSRLSSENAKLREELAKHDGVIDTSGLEQGEDAVTIWFDTIIDGERQMGPHLIASWREVFLHVAERIQMNTTLESIGYMFLEWYADYHNLAPDDYDFELTIKIRSNTMLEVSTQLQALGLIDVVPAGATTQWHLTRLGTREYLNEKAIRSFSRSQP